MIRVDHNCEYHLVGEASVRIVGFPPQAGAVRKSFLTEANPAPGVLFAGPWVGEFGWEVARWQGAVRKCSKESGLYTIVMSRPGHQVLYRDFADQFWELPQSFLDARLIPQCDHVRPAVGDPMPGLHTQDALLSLAAQIYAELANVSGPLREILSPRKFRPEEQTIVKLSAPTAEWSAGVDRPYFCVLPRSRTWNPEKNWPAGHWETLISRCLGCGMSAFTVGSPADMMCLHRLCAIADADALTRSIDLLSHASFAIAPESGGALLSLMCGCPTLVFGHERQRVRITSPPPGGENFLGTKVKYLSRSDYDFSVDEVAEGARELQRDL